jgi:Holliday junction resolvase RusA-like endonuclease
MSSLFVAPATATDRVEFTLPGTPIARPRPRAMGFRAKTGKIKTRLYQPTKIVISKTTGRPTPESVAWVKSHEWYEAVKRAVASQLPKEPWTGPVYLMANIYFERPQYMLANKWPDGPIWHTAKPDRDNLDKGITDPLQEAGLYRDDSQICDGAIRKWYAARGCGPGVVVTAWRILHTGDGGSLLEDQ